MVEKNKNTKCGYEKGSFVQSKYKLFRSKCIITRVEAIIERLHDVLILENHEKKLITTKVKENTTETLHKASLAVSINQCYCQLKQLKIIFGNKIKYEP